MCVDGERREDLRIRRGKIDISSGILGTFLVTAAGGLYQYHAQVLASATLHPHFTLTSLHVTLNPGRFANMVPLPDRPRRKRPSSSSSVAVLTVFISPVHYSSHPCLHFWLRPRETRYP